MKILAFAGSARSGKDSSLKYVFGQILKKNDVIDKFDITEDGRLLVPAQFEDGVRMSEFDIDRRDYAFSAYASECIWPLVKNYSFAFALKEIILSLYNIEHKGLYGSTEDRDALSSYTYEPFIKMLPKGIIGKTPKKEDGISNRKFIQHFADIIRTIDDKCLTKLLTDQIKVEQAPITLINDCRRHVEVESLRELDAKIIYLTRNDSGDSHSIENEFEGCDLSIFDAVIDNKNMNIEEKNREVHRLCESWQIF